MIGPVTLSIHAEAMNRARLTARRRLDIVDQADAGMTDVPEDQLTETDFLAALDRVLTNGQHIERGPMRARYSTLAEYLAQCAGHATVSPTAAGTPATVQGALF